MKTLKNKTMATMITLFLMLTITATLLFVPVTDAHQPPWTFVTHTYIAVVPPVTGVGQQMLFIWWVNWIPPTSSGEYGDRWKAYIDITKPDGTNETLGPSVSDPVGGSYVSYTPTQLGMYTAVCRFPGQVLTGYPTQNNLPPTNIDVNDTFAASTSPPVNFTVQQDQIPLYVENPLPTDYWTRPIYSTNRFWYAIAADWLGGSSQTNGPTTSFAYGTGPESAHVLWTRSYWTGGEMDAKFQAINGYGGMSYESFGSPTIIMDGKLWYTVSTPPREGYYCLNLYTGDVISFTNTTGPASGQGIGGFDSSGSISYGAPAYGEVLDIETPNQHGAFSYFWVTSTSVTNKWDLYDSFSNNYICSIANVSSSGTQFTDAWGGICYVNMANLGTATAPNYYMQIWNTTEAIWWKPWYGAYAPKTLVNGSNTLSSTAPTGTVLGATANAYWMWRPYLNYTFDGNIGYSMNVSVANINGPQNAVINQTGTIRAVRPDKYVIVGTDGRNDARGIVQGYLRAYSLAAPTWGKTLWTTTFTPPAAADAYPNATYSSLGNPSMQSVDPEDGVFVFTDRITNKWWTYSLATGELLWTSAPEGQFNYYGISMNIYQGKLITYGYMGQLIAYNITTGEVLWNWAAPSYGLGETYYTYTPLSFGCICDGKIYLYTSEHSPNAPLRRDAHVWCIDLTTGQNLWAISCWGAPKIADGDLLVLNAFDQQIYCIGKGPSATTVSAPQSGASVGSALEITGTVTDQSPSGRHNEAGNLDFTLKGTPAISDASMEVWMEHMFQQQPIPSNTTGVPVTLSAIDPNGNSIHIGDVTSDVSGSYGCQFTPQIPGQFQIIATFAGSASYGGSSDTTYMVVNEAAPTPIPTSQPVTLESTQTYILAGVIAIIITIAIVGALIVLILRKRP
jgi:hypothetical protein